MHPLAVCSKYLVSHTKSYHFEVPLDFHSFSIFLDEYVLLKIKSRENEIIEYGRKRNQKSTGVMSETPKTKNDCL